MKFRFETFAMESAKAALPTRCFEEKARRQNKPKTFSIRIGRSIQPHRELIKRISWRFSIGRFSEQRVIASHMRADEMPRPEGHSKSKPHLFIGVVLCIHLAVCFLVLAKNVSHPKTSERLLSSDSVHYVDIARDFASGDFSMQYVKERPHRQPLYPAFLAIALKLGNGNRFMLGAVNVLVATVSLLSVYVIILALFNNRFAASVSALALAANPFIDREITARLLTEPLHLLLTIWAIFAFLRYLQGQNWRWLFACAAILGLDYLTRPNGLFMAGAAIGTMALSDLLAYFAAAQGRPSFFRWLMRHAGIYLVAVAIFLAASTPSWVPRLVYFGTLFITGTSKITCGSTPTKRDMWVKAMPLIPGATILRTITYVGCPFAVNPWFPEYLFSYSDHDGTGPLALFVQYRRGLDRVPNCWQGIPLFVLVSCAPDAAARLDQYVQPDRASTVRLDASVRAFSGRIISILDLRTAACSVLVSMTEAELRN